MRYSASCVLATLGIAALLCQSGELTAADGTRDQAIAAIRRAATFYREKVAVHGGYVYYTSLDLKRRWGEGVAGPERIWVQPPGTPTVGLAYLAAWEATRDKYYLEAAQETAESLLYGQLESGGWTNSIDFNPRGETAQYRNGKGKGRNYSTLDDGITQAALRCLARVDQALEFKNQELHDATLAAIDALLAAQFPNGAFPQVWSGAVQDQPIVKARFPDYDWRTENRIKEYWNLYTLNDDLSGRVATALLDLAAVYRDPRCQAALVKLGDFIVLAQLPDPQPAWAQQYDYDMRPVWARKFEPPAVTGRESQDAIATLMTVFEQTGDKKYLVPIPRALAYLQASLLPDGRLARYYELQTNKPLYMTKDYKLTHDDSDVPQHYGWKVASNLKDLERRYAQLSSGKRVSPPPPDRKQLEAEALRVIGELDKEGCWISVHKGAPLVGQPKFKNGAKFLSSAVFSQNLETLSRYVAATRQ